MLRNNRHSNRILDSQIYIPSFLFFLVSDLPFYFSQAKPLTTNLHMPSIRLQPLEYLLSLHQQIVEMLRTVRELPVQPELP